MKKSNVYTRTGDQGQTSLVGGKRVPKASLRLDSYGTVDELNSQMGLLLTYVEDDAIRRQLIDIQCMLFSVGGALATDPESEYATADGYVTDDIITQLEHDIDLLHDGLPAWRGFTLPGGCRGAAVAHVCRCVCRRAERRILALAEVEQVPANVVKYINRLSDYLYVLALRLNYLAGTEEILWQKRL